MNVVEHSTWYVDNPTPTDDALPRILLIDDDVDLWPLIGAILRPTGMQLTFARSAHDGCRRAREIRPHAILLDHMLPDGTALDVLRVIRKEDGLRNTPIVIVTGRGDSETLMSLFSGGATDYLRKPLVSAELRARLQSIVERQRLIGDLSRAASQDELTGLPNLQRLMERLHEAFVRAPEQRQNVALLVLDLDRFKVVNDGFGRATGDRVMREIAMRLRAAAMSARAHELQDHRLIARIGGDKFAVLVEGVQDSAGVEALAERLLTAVSEPLIIDQQVLHLTASVGVVHGREQNHSAEDMLRDGDIAMFAAKARGKGCHERFAPDMRTALHQRVTLERALRAAIGTDQIQVAYQPIVALGSCRLESVEALVRWEHPELGRVMPDEFIPLAEETRLIIPLSEAVLRRACADFMQWQRCSPDSAPRSLSVNLSRVELTDVSLPDRVLAIVTEFGMQPEQLQLEITESQLMEQRDQARAIVERLRGFGMRLAMDDFGNGYSSLACLQEFAFDVLKIDRGLTQQISEDGTGAALLRSVMRIAQDFGLKVVAEGIEQPLEAEFLQHIGCEYGQGYLLARPMSAAQLQLWWAGSSRPRRTAEWRVCEQSSA